jgi:hypothetical protein
VLSGSQDGTARLSNIATGKVLAVLRHGRLGDRRAGADAVGAAAVGGAGVDVVGRPRVDAGTATVALRGGGGAAAAGGAGEGGDDGVAEAEEDEYPSVEA